MRFGVLPPSPSTHTIRYITFLYLLYLIQLGISCQSYINNIENMVIQFSVGWLPLWAD